MTRRAALLPLLFAAFAAASEGCCHRQCNRPFFGRYGCCDACPPFVPPPGAGSFYARRGIPTGGPVEGFPISADAPGCSTCASGGAPVYGPTQVGYPSPSISYGPPPGSVFTGPPTTIGPPTGIAPPPHVVPSPMPQGK